MALPEAMSARIARCGGCPKPGAGSDAVDFNPELARVFRGFVYLAAVIGWFSRKVLA